MRLLIAILFSPFLGCVAIPQAASSSPAAAQPVLQKQSIPAPPSATLRTWVSFAEIQGKTIDEIRAMNIGCFYILKPEMRQESMVLLFEIHQRVTGRPYLYTIIESWMTKQRIGMVDRGNSLLFPYCEDNWQFGDLNADGRVDYEDFAIYGRVQ